jgi:23S rRNA (uracil1939-C5)-methyltransferase
LSEESIEKATMNAKNHNVENARFFAMNLHSKEALTLLQHQKKPNTIVIDPPRAGSHPDLIGYLNTSGIDKIVYVSCNPTTQARDCAMLDNYSVDAVTAVDLFPQTYHIESVALLTKRTNG